MSEPAPHARYADGQSALLHDVSLHRVGPLLVIRALPHGEELAAWRIRQIKMERAPSSILLHVGGAAQITGEDPAIAGLLRPDGPSRHQPSARDHRMAWAVAGTVLVISLALGAYAMAPGISRALARQVPLETEASLAEPAIAELRPHFCDAPEVQGPIDQLVSRLDPGNRVQASAHVVHMDLPNAFALPGGTVLVTTGLLQKMDSPDALAGVLAHELAHVERRDVTAGIIQASLLTMLWASLFGDVSGLMVLDPATTMELARLSYSRKVEAAADDAALQMLADANISPDGFVSFFEDLSEQDIPGLQWLSSHPPSGDRAQRAAGTGRSGMASPALSDDRWRQVRQACQGQQPMATRTLLEL